MPISNAIINNLHVQWRKLQFAQIKVTNLIKQGLYLRQSLRDKQHSIMSIKSSVPLSPNTTKRSSVGNY